MIAPAISVTALGKRYRLSVAAQRAQGLRRVAQVLGLGRRAARASDLWAIRDISFAVEPGEIVGLIGRNGAGKSTLLKILSRVTEPTAGRALVNGRVGSLLEVGTGFHPDLSGRDNIYLNGAILGMSRAEIRVRFDEIVAFAEIDRFLDTPVKRYSSGMYVRLAFAVAAHLEPEILLVDEVLAVGDTAFQRKCLGKMSEVSRGGRTILFVSHNLAAVEGLCTRAVLLEGGRVVHDGAVRDALSRYLQSHGEGGARELSARKDRSGSGAVRFVGLRLLDEWGSEIPCLATGRDAILEIDYRCAAAHPPRQASISIGIDSSFGQRVAHLSSDAAAATIVPSADGVGSVRVRLPRLALLPGRYHYTLYCEAGGTIADWIQNAGSFDVEAGDFFGSGKLPPSGVVCLECEFETREAACC